MQKFRLSADDFFSEVSLFFCETPYAWLHPLAFSREDQRSSRALILFPPRDDSPSKSRRYLELFYPVSCRQFATYKRIDTTTRVYPISGSPAYRKLGRH